jgi:hypothetical protein
MSAPITEAHRELARNIMFYHTPKGSATAQGVRDAAQLIADSEARANERLRREIEWLQLNNDMLTDNPVGHARAVAERQTIIAERDELRAEVERLKADGAASAFINMSCRASRAETDCNNLRADLDAIKAILTEEKARAERAEAELAAERARLDWLASPQGRLWQRQNESALVCRDTIDAAMKGGA